MGSTSVEDDVDFSIIRLLRRDVLQESDELLRRVALDRLADDFSGRRIQGREQRQRSVPDILETVPLGPPGRQGLFFWHPQGMAHG